MISGVVNAQREATVQLVIHDSTGQPHDVEVALDEAAEERHGVLDALALSAHGSKITQRTGCQTFQVVRFADALEGGQVQRS